MAFANVIGSSHLYEFFYSFADLSFWTCELILLIAATEVVLPGVAEVTVARVNGDAEEFQVGNLLAADIKTASWFLE
ncbi:MAG: hypothetical protein GWN00_30055 [Aliifodinibius sp.]|nr:hypothetical protein [Fodinibius sp.]NIV15034.1 hypothetical protein [Fodinibius sp.]NIY28882.1 hypothetical protein [Fodinibius sp.]